MLKKQKKTRFLFGRCQRTVKLGIKQHFFLCLKISKHRKRKTLRFLCFSFNYCFIRERKSFLVEEVVLCAFLVWISSFWCCSFGVRFLHRWPTQAGRKENIEAVKVENKVRNIFHFLWRFYRWNSLESHHCPINANVSTTHLAWFHHPAVHFSGFSSQKKKHIIFHGRIKSHWTQRQQRLKAAVKMNFQLGRW